MAAVVWLIAGFALIAAEVLTGGFVLIMLGVGALVAAVIIFIFFLVVAPAFRSPESFFTVLYQSSTIGIVAVGVGMLMIGGEFDLSAGVIVTTAGLVNSMLSWNYGINLWVGALVSLVFCLFVGFVNGYLVMRTGIPSFLITLVVAVKLTGRDGHVIYENKNYVFRQQYQSTTDLPVYFDESPAAVERLSRDFARALVADVLEGL